MTFLSIPALQPHSVDIRFRFVSKYGEDNAGPLPILRRCNGGAGIELSVHDPELRHGHKSSRRRFNGHKAAIVVDTDSQLITAVDVLPGNAPDNLGALELVEASEASTGSVVEETMGDAAYGYGGTRQTFAEAGRQLVAKVPGRPNRSHFPKDDFHLDLAAGGVNLNSIATENEGQHGVVIITTDRTDGPRPCDPQRSGLQSSL